MKLALTAFIIVGVMVLAIVIGRTAPQDQARLSMTATADRRMDVIYPTRVYPTLTPTITLTPTSTPNYPATEAVQQLAILAAQQTIDLATRQAGEMTQAAVQATQSARSTAEYISARQTAEAQQSTQAAVAAVETQSAVGTSTAQALLVVSTQAAINATQDANKATATAEATLFALQVADINYKQSANKTQIALDLQRREVTNQALAVSPYIIGGILLLAVTWLLIRFGAVEANRRKMVDGLLLDERAGNLNIVQPDRMATPGAVSTRRGLTLQSVDPQLQAQTTARAQAVQALRASNGNQTQAARMLKEEPAPVINTVRALPASADWHEITNRKPGMLLLGEGSEGTISARQDTPHVLIAGQTGSGKSTAMRSIITQHLLDGRRVTILDKSGRDFGIFGSHATVITLDASQPDAAISKLIAYLKSAWVEVLRRQHHARPTWQGMIDVLVVDELDNWQDISTDSDTSGRRLWQYPRMISREGRASGIYLLAASQNPTAQNISIDLRRNCTPVAFRLADGAASRIIIDSSDAVSLGTGQFIARVDRTVRGVGYNMSDSDIRSLLHGVKPQGRPEWLDTVDYPTLEPVEDWKERAKKLYAQGIGMNEISRQVFGYVGGAAHAQLKSLLGNDTAVTTPGNGQ